MSTTSPLVSVCIPVYNAADYFHETFRSVLAQTYAHWELIIVENRSTDGSRELIDEIVSEAGDQRVQLFLNDSHLGMAGNMNKALSLARGDFVKLLCADDIIEPRCLEKQAAALLQHPSAVMASCSRNITSPDGRTLFVRSAFRASGVKAGRSLIKQCLWAGTNLIGEPTSVLLRSSVLSSMPHLDGEARYWIDLDLWTRILLRGDLYFDTEPLARFRIHGRAATRTFERGAVSDFLALASLRLEEMGSRLGLVQTLWLHGKVRVLNLIRRWVYQRYGGPRDLGA